MSPDQPDPPDRCLLHHPVFTTLGTVSFRRARADGTPVMVVLLGEREAVIPLRALQREFAIDDGSPDGRMLGLIAESLDYVCGLSLGDPLPSEVLDGRASWQPGTEHRRLAFGRLRLQLLAWIDPAAADSAMVDPVRRLENDPALRQKVQRAFERAARVLELPSADDVLSMVEGLAGEMAFIEALRDRLLLPVQALAERLERLAQGYRGDHQRQETLNRVLRLATLARDRFAAQFDEVAAQTGEVIGALRNLESQQAFIRSNRDQLYRSLRAWQPVLDDWAAHDGTEVEGMWDIVTRTYQFLAPRYMPVTEWAAPSQVARTKQPAQAMTW